MNEYSYHYIKPCKGLILLAQYGAQRPDSYRGRGIVKINIGFGVIFDGVA